MEISNVEKEIINTLRELKPHERIEIVKDQTGKPDYYIVHRSQKVLLSP